MPPSKRPTKKRFLELCRKYNTRREIARELNVVPATVTKYAKEFNINLADYGMKKDVLKERPPKELFEERYNDLTTPVKDLAVEFNLSTATLNKLRISLNIPPRKMTPNDTAEFTAQQIVSYIQERSTPPVCKKLRIGDDRLRKTLKGAGVNIPSVGVASKIQSHSNGDYWVPIPEKLQRIFDGSLLGDAYLVCQLDNNGSKWLLPLSHYWDAINDLRRLERSQFSSESEIALAIQDFNRSTEIISGAQVAYFKIAKSVLEEPWVRFINQRLQPYGYSGHTQLIPEEIRIRTMSTVQLYRQYQRWYPGGLKHVPCDVKLPPETVHHWFIGDGSALSTSIKLSTHGFSLSENKFLANLLSRVAGIKARVVPTESYHMITITHRNNISKFFDYLDEAPKDALSLTKQLFPWKFDCKLRKKDVYDRDNNFVDEQYLETFLNLLKQAGIKLSDRTEQLHYLFPWIFPLSDRV